MKKLIVITFVILTSCLHAQTTGTVQGYITNQNGEPLLNVNVTFDSSGVVSNQKGYYTIEIPVDMGVDLIFSHLSYEETVQNVVVHSNKVLQLDIVLESKIETIAEVNITTKKDAIKGITKLNTSTIKNTVSPNQGIEGALKLVGLGTSSDNELSSQYKVRGGNYNENLVYINGVEVYRPFLIRSGQQEGLSVLNQDMVSQVQFSSGGFDASYGDKLSSVLDIKYKKPQKNKLKVMMSLISASLTVEGVSKSNNTSGILGVRYKNNNLLINRTSENGEYKPQFTDVQTLLNYKINKKLKFSFLGNYAINNYQYIPGIRATNFGTIQNPKELLIYSEGLEQDKFQTTFGAITLDYITDNLWKWQLTTSLFNTQEEEFFDINAQYFLNNDVDNETSNDYEVSINKGVFSQLDHARNQLDALISQVQLKTTLYNGQNTWYFGGKYQFENVKDRLVEWEVLDSMGYMVRPKGYNQNNQPYTSFDQLLIPFQNVRAYNELSINRISAFAQWNRQMIIGQSDLWLNLGVRGQYWNLENIDNTIVSPRLKITLKPNWKKDMLFRLSGGLYVQPPEYKSLRNFSGVINKDVKAQNSYQIVLGGDYNFKLWNRPFKIVSEGYYKYLDHVNPYVVDNVRVRYLAHNNAEAYAYGCDFRINGEFVPGTESWFNFGYLKTEQNIAKRGWIARPTDQRLKFSLLFQDYVPSVPKLKMYLNLVYNTGVPGGSPVTADVYQYQLRLDDYKRADIGIHYMIKDTQTENTSKFMKHFKTFSIGTEIFNVFDIKNAISNTWVRDVYSGRMYGVKNYMTGRMFNLKVSFEL